jgi:hypothetical protein
VQSAVNVGGGVDYFRKAPAKMPSDRLTYQTSVFCGSVITNYYDWYYHDRLQVSRIFLRAPFYVNPDP